MCFCATCDTAPLDRQRNAAVTTPTPVVPAVSHSWADGPGTTDHRWPGAGCTAMSSGCGVEFVEADGDTCRVNRECDVGRIAHRELDGIHRVRVSSDVTIDLGLPEKGTGVADEQRDVSASSWQCVASDRGGFPDSECCPIGAKRTSSRVSMNGTGWKW